MKEQIKTLKFIWSITRFNSDAVTAYAEDMMLVDTRRGIALLGRISLIMLAAAGAVYFLLGFDLLYAYTCAILALLSLHVSISSRFVRDTQGLYLLATTLLVVICAAFALLAHRSAEFSPSLLVSIIFLFMVIPLVPWGLRETVTVILLIYFIFTLSPFSVRGRFDHDTLIVLQFLMFGAGMTTLVVTARNADIRKNDINMRFALEEAHRKMERLSFQDPLTGTWNRRFLETKFDEITGGYLQTLKHYHFALIDMDNFKHLNDTCGHACGDSALIRLTQEFRRRLSDHDYFIRLGGDEFALVYSGPEIETLMHDVNETLKNASLISNTPSLAFSAGVIRVSVADEVTLDRLYRKADVALYGNKSKKMGTKKRINFPSIIQA